MPTPQRGGHFQLVKKSLAEFRVRRRESSMICFLPRHVRGGKHFARSERRIVRYQRTTEAQSAAKLSRKSGKATFSTVSAPLQRGLSLTCLYVNDWGIGRAAATAACSPVQLCCGKIPPTKIWRFLSPPFSREARVLAWLWLHSILH